MKKGTALGGWLLYLEQQLRRPIGFLDGSAAELRANTHLSAIPLRPGSRGAQKPLASFELDPKSGNRTFTSQILRTQEG